MAVYSWSTLVAGQTINAFDPTSDTLQFDDTSISAAAVLVQAVGDSSTRFTFGDKTVIVALPLFAITTGNVDFADFSQLIVGDNLAGTDFDDTGGELGSGDGNDQFIAGAGGYIVLASPGNDLLTGGSDDDELDGQAGNDRMIGGTGDDLYFVDSSGDQVTESADEGFDRVISSASFTLGPDIEWLALTGSAPLTGTGNELANIIDGNDGANVLFGHGGDDDLSGWDGDDHLHGGAGADVLDGGEGFDYASYVSSSVGLTVDMTGDEGSTGDAAGEAWGSIEGIVGSSFNDRIIGDAGDNHLDGRDGNDQILGITGNDRIDGGNGDDLLDGGLGMDELIGGAGNDMFYFDTEQADGDVITDFEGNGEAAGDQLVFNGYGTAADGATFIQLDATRWQITSAGGGLQETLTFSNAPVVHSTDYMFI